MFLQLGITGGLAICAGFLTASIGFGGAIWMMLFLPALFPFDRASAISSISVYLCILALCIQYRKRIRWELLPLPVIVYSLTGTAVIRFVNVNLASWIAPAFGLFLIAAGVFPLVSDKIRISNTPAVSVACAFLSGIGNGLFGIGGPPMGVYFFSATDGEKEAYIGTLQAFFALCLISTTAARVRSGILGLSEIPAVIVCMLGSLLGKRAGTLLLNRLNKKTLQRCVSIFVVFAGIRTLIS
ncbi:MAG: sulfite exporter TauE/SafE family protein [Clostridium sp.]|nr:sulfite exporter TauE/SafE family protein [Clostridium sp.]